MTALRAGTDLGVALGGRGHDAALGQTRGGGAIEALAQHEARIRVDQDSPAPADQVREVGVGRVHAVALLMQTEVDPAHDVADQVEREIGARHAEESSTVADHGRGQTDHGDVDPPASKYGSETWNVPLAFGPLNHSHFSSW